MLKWDLVCFHVAVSDYIANFDMKIGPYVNLKSRLDAADLERLGKKDHDAYPCRTRYLK